MLPLDIHFNIQILQKIILIKPSWLVLFIAMEPFVADAVP